jgi:hypothetical protein
MLSMGASGPIAASMVNATNANIISLASAGLSGNKYILGIIILLINLGARYIGNELNDFSHKILNHKFARRFLIFLVIWMGTRDLICAIILTTCFIVLSNTLLNEQSNYCILPLDNPTPISKEEYEIAKQIIQKYENSFPITLNNNSNSSNTTAFKQ